MKQTAVQVTDGRWPAWEKTERRWEVEERRSWVDVLCISGVRNCESCTDGMLSPSSSSPSISLLCPGTAATWHDLFMWASPGSRGLSRVKSSVHISGVWCLDEIYEVLIGREQSILFKLFLIIFLALSLFHYLDWTTQRDYSKYGKERGWRTAKGPQVGSEPRTAEESGELNEQQYLTITNNTRSASLIQVRIQQKIFDLWPLHPTVCFNKDSSEYGGKHSSSKKSFQVVKHLI